VAQASQIALPAFIDAGTSTDALVRAIHGSPDAGPVDIYVYETGAKRPSKPTVGDAEFPQITNFLSLKPGSYTIDVVAPAGAKSTTKAVASEKVTVKADTRYSVVVGGQVAKKTLRFINFVDPNESSDKTALTVHHASPYVQSAIDKVGVGVYNAADKVPAKIADVFEFSLATGISGPAADGKVDGGEFFLSPLPDGLPKKIGFAAGIPETGGDFKTLISATPSELAKDLKHPTADETALAKDTASEVPAGAHLSIFAVDTKSAAELIGTLDP
jgi:hypothetical protein